MATRKVNRQSGRDPRVRGPRGGTRPVRRTERGEQRRQALVEASLAVFLEQGYERASIEEVMRRVGGSKASLYSYFGSKEGLFSEVVLTQFDRFLQDLQLPDRADAHVERTLTAIGCRFLHKLSEPSALGLFRIIVAEAPRFPVLAERFYEQGAMRVRHQLGHYLRLQHEAGRVNCPDPEASAMYFFELVRGPHLRLLLGVPPQPRDPSPDRYVAAAVKVFLHGCAGPAAGRGAAQR